MSDVTGLLRTIGIDVGTLSVFEIAGIAALAVAAAWYDVRARRVPNWLTVGAAIYGLVPLAAAGITGAGWSHFGGHALGLLLGIGLLFPPFYFGGIGAGDVKLLGAIGAMGGAQVAFLTFLGGAVLGGFGSLAVLIYRRQAKRVLRKLAWNATAALLPGGLLREAAIPLEKLPSATGAVGATESPSGKTALVFPYAIAIGAGALLVLVLA